MLLYLIGDEDISGLIKSGYVKEVYSRANNILIRIHRNTSAARIRQVIFNAREAWADRVAEKVTSKAAFMTIGFFQKAAWATRHPVLGWPILLLILWATFYGVGTIATKMASVLDSWIFLPLTGVFASLSDVSPVLNDFLVGERSCLF